MMAAIEAVGFSATLVQNHDAGSLATQHMSGYQARLVSRPKYLRRVAACCP